MAKAKKEAVVPKVEIQISYQKHESPLKDEKSLYDILLASITPIKDFHNFSEYTGISMEDVKKGDTIIVVCLEYRTLGGYGYDVEDQEVFFGVKTVEEMNKILETPDDIDGVYDFDEVVNIVARALTVV